MAETDEAELLGRARLGERSAFDRLQERLEPGVRRFIRRLIGKADAEDEIAQDAFLALYLNLGRVSPATNLRPFLFRVVRNLCYDELRRRGRFKWVPLDDSDRAAESGSGMDPPGPSPPTSVPAPDDQVAWIVLFGQIRKAMDKLPEPQRQALILYALEDLSYAEVAEALETDIGTVKSRIHYARLSLERLLGPHIREALGLSQKEESR